VAVMRHIVPELVPLAISHLVSTPAAHKQTGCGTFHILFIKPLNNLLLLQHMPVPLAICHLISTPAGQRAVQCTCIRVH
jgi:hypothetical protein